jgi:hypothetical protein
MGVVSLVGEHLPRHASRGMEDGDRQGAAQHTNGGCRHRQP